MVDVLRHHEVEVEEQSVVFTTRADWEQEAQRVAASIETQRKLEEILIASGQLPEVRRIHRGNMVIEQPYKTGVLYDLERQLHYVRYRLRIFSE